MTTSFESSDAVRTAKPLRFAQSVTFAEPLRLEKGGLLPHVTVAFETYGHLNAARDNAVLICHALSGDSHVARHDPQDDPGWWDLVVGPGKPIDTDRYFVVCPNVLGGCRGTSGPSDVNPATAKPYGGDFPIITVVDIVDVQARLLDHLGIRKVLGVIGGSMGGHQVITWATRYADRVAGAIAIATSPRLTNQALAFDIVGRNAIIRDPHFNGGQYYEHGGTGGGPNVGLAVARMLAHITYLSPESMAEKFDADRLEPRGLQTEFETKFSVGSYLAYQGHRFVERFDANSYIALTMAMDLFDLGRDDEQRARKLAASTCRWLILSFSSDWLFPPFQSQDLARALIKINRPVTYAMIESRCGHDAFLLADDIDRYGELVRAFLANLLTATSPGHADGTGEVGEVAGPKAEHKPTSIFHGDRLDYELIARLIPQDASVLDLGCGNGGLLARLKHRGNPRLMGIELDEHAVVACARQGLDVIRADLNLGLPDFADGQFDFVVLSQTLQTVRDVQAVLRSVVRVGHKAIVSFPNLAYAPLRQQLMEEGRAPRKSKLLGYTWYETPNIRFLSIADFEDFCAAKGIAIHQKVALNTERKCAIEEDANLNADLAIFVVSG